MRRIITALLVSAALAGSTGVSAQGYGDRHRRGGSDNDNQGQMNQRGQGNPGGQGSQGTTNTQSSMSQQQSQGQGQGQGQNEMRRSRWNQGGDHHWQGNDNRGDHDNDRWRSERRGDWNNNDNDRWRSEHRGEWNNTDNNRRWSSDNNRRWDNDNNRRWNNNWRNDRRWNWQALRNRDRNRFNLPRYNAPRGSHYRRFYRGFRLAPFFFAREYWFDAGDYGLPPAYGPYRWVRYFNDALLVNIYTGEIEDVIPNFFW